MQIVLQRVDETDKETFPLIKMLKFLSVRKSISCGTGHYLLPKRGGSGCLERFAFPSAYIIKKQTTYRSLTRQVSVEGKNLQKSKFPRLIFFSEQGLCNVPSNSPSFLFKGISCLNWFQLTSSIFLRFP